MDWRNDLSWLNDAREEGRMTERLIAYATAVTADEIPYFILDPILGVDLSHRVRQDGEQEEA